MRKKKLFISWFPATRNRVDEHGGPRNIIYAINLLNCYVLFQQKVVYTTMSNLFYQATRVAVDGRLLRIFNGSCLNGSKPLRLDQNEEVVNTIVGDSRRGDSSKQIARKLGIAPSTVTKIKDIFRERWEGFKE